MTFKCPEPPVNGNPLGQGLGLSRGFAQHVRGNFFQPHAKLEHRSFDAPSPARYFPVRAHELHIRMRRQIKQ